MPKIQDMDSFAALGPDEIISTAEAATSSHFTPYCLALNSYINRVYELEKEDGTRLIAKFYRPGRWSKKAILEEHAFVGELAQQELSVVSPLSLNGDQTLFCHNSIYYALYPKRSGRFLDEYSLEQWQELGRFIGRMHTIAATKKAEARPVLLPDHMTRKQIEFLLSGDFFPSELAPLFERVCRELLELITPLFTDADTIRLHGDCHFGNILHRSQESFLLIDFDDMVMGPAVQDFWMVLPGYRDDSFQEIEHFLDGYEVFRAFDRRELALIEPLRAMRYIHFMAWCAYQSHDRQAASTIIPDWGTEGYWQREIGDLETQIVRIKQGNSQEFYQGW
ncbi:MAG: serine/threonine protein kinase [Thermodesulfobacteriota bacterium]